MIGFIGLGIMGKPMAKNLLKSGYEIICYDINEAAVKEVVEAGAVEGKSSKEIAQKCDTIITMLPNSPHVETVILGEDGVLEGAKEGTVIIDMSSIDPTVTKKLYSVLKEKGIDLIDAPVSGGEPKAVDGTLSIMVGGEEKVYNKVKDILLNMGASAVYVGESGSGNVAKLANQIVVACNIAAVSEALTLAVKEGVDPGKVFQAIRGGLAGSTVMDAKAPMMLDRNFKPGFRIDLHIKDLLNAVAAGQSIDSPVPLAVQVLEMMKVLKINNCQNQDHSALVKYYEHLANIEVSSASI